MGGALADRGSDTVRAGIAAANHYNMFALCRDAIVRVDRQAGNEPVVLGEEFHREMHAGQVPSRDLEVAGRFGAAGQEDGVKMSAQIVGRDVLPRIDTAFKDNSFGFHLVNPPADQSLFELEIGDAEP